MKRDSSRLLSSDLREHPFWWERTPRSKEDPPHLPASTDVLIVGSGYTGLCAALQTARGGRSTLVVDAAEPGWGCSSRNGGQIGTGIKPDFAALEKEHGRETAYEVHREGQRALSWIGEFIREENIDCDYRVCGRFFGAHTPRHYDQLARKLESQPPGLEMEAFLVPRADQPKEIDTEFYHGGVVQCVSTPPSTRPPITKGFLPGRKRAVSRSLAIPELQPLSAAAIERVLWLRQTGDVCEPARW